MFRTNPCQPGANAKAVVFKLKLGIEPIRQRPHELEA